jgi:tRNA pseudouridine55 synthase
VNGVVVIDKAQGPTSHDVVDGVRRALGVRRCGHTGTLDPFATGVLPVCVGHATRLVRFLAATEKVYVAGIRLGFATTTDDVTGEPLGPPVPVACTDEAIHAACARLTGDLDQVPPAFSAKRIDGQRAYARARRGEAVTLAACRVRVDAFELEARDQDRLTVLVRCAPGTYVRSLARDLGTLLGVGGHLTTLRRTRSGSFGLDRAVAVASLRPDHLVPLEDLLVEWPAVRVTAEGARAVAQGRNLDPRLVAEGFPEDSPPPRLRILDGSGRLLGLAVPQGFGPAPADLPRRASLHPDVVFPPADPGSDP